MGKLRKIGRQLKKGIKKLFKSPLGGILKILQLVLLTRQ